MMLDAKRTFDQLIEHLAPDERTRDEVFANRIYQQLSSAVAGSQEFTAIAKLYELDQEGDFDVLVLDTPPSRNALDFLDAPGRLTALLPGPRDPHVPAPGRALGPHPRPRHRRRVRRPAARHRRRPAARPVGLLPLARRHDRRLHRARPARRRAARGPGDDVPDRHRAAPRPGRGGDLLPPQAARGGDAVRRPRRQPRPPAARRRAAGRRWPADLGPALAERVVGRDARAQRRWPPATPRTCGGCATRSATRRRSSSPSSRTTSTTSRASPLCAHTCSRLASSATRRSAGSRWPQSTSRRTARRQPPSSPTSASTSGAGAHEAGHRRALERDRLAHALLERGAVVRPRRRSRPAARRRRRSRRGRCRRTARGRRAASPSAPRRRSPRSQPSSKRRSAQASSPARGVRRATSAAERAQRVLLLGARAGSRRAARRRPVASGTAIHGLPSVRAQAVGPSAGSASSHRRSAVCSRRRRRPAASSARPVAVARLEREHGDRGVRVLGQPGGRVGERRRRARARARRRAAPRRTRSRAPRRA